MESIDGIWSSEDVLIRLTKGEICEDLIHQGSGFSTQRSFSAYLDIVKADYLDGLFLKDLLFKSVLPKRPYRLFIPAVGRVQPVVRKVSGILVVKDQRLLKLELELEGTIIWRSFPEPV